jgi:hypothetical protein
MIDSAHSRVVAINGSSSSVMRREGLAAPTQPQGRRVAKPVRAAGPLVSVDRRGGLRAEWHPAALAAFTAADDGAALLKVDVGALQARLEHQPHDRFVAAVDEFLSAQAFKSRFSCSSLSASMTLLSSFGGLTPSSGLESSPPLSASRAANLRNAIWRERVIVERVSELAGRRDFSGE